MSDPRTLERYCSSYYDKHGLYNDGFPCPADKYCCQNDDGTKKCCSIEAEMKIEEPKTSDEQVKEPPRHHQHHNPNHHRNMNRNNPSSLFQQPESKANRNDPSSSFKSYMLTTIQSNIRQQQQQQQQQMVKLTNYEQFNPDQYNQYGIRQGPNGLGSIDPASPAIYGGATVAPFFLSK